MSCVQDAAGEVVPGCMRARIPCESCSVQAAHVRARFMCTRAARSRSCSGATMRHDHVISVVSSSDKEEKAEEEDFRDDLRRQPRSRQAVLRKAAAPGDLDGFAFVEDDHLAQFYVDIDPKLIHVEVEWKDPRGKTATRRAERTSSCGTSVTAAGVFATFTCTALVLHFLPAGFG
jgi:hypothetical protein